MARLSMWCACIGCGADGLRHSIARVRAMDTAAVLSAISRASAVAAAADPRARAPNAPIRPPTPHRRRTHGRSCTIPAPADSRPSGAGTTMTPPLARCRAARTRNRSAHSVEASRISIGSCMVTPMPTAAPLIAPMTGFVHWKMRKRQHSAPIAHARVGKVGHRLHRWRTGRRRYPASGRHRRRTPCPPRSRSPREQRHRHRSDRTHRSSRPSSRW